MTETFKYRAFIRYSHADRALADRLHRALESYRIPKRLTGVQGREGPSRPSCSQPSATGKNSASSPT